MIDNEGLKLIEGENMTMRSQFVRRSRQLLLCGAVAFGLAGSALAQSAASAKPAAQADADYGYSKWDITPFFGWQWYQAFQGNNDRNYAARFKSGWVFGERYNFDVTPKVSFEASMTLGSNRLLLRPDGQTNSVASIPTKSIQGAFDLVYHFQPRTAKNRFFVMAGPAGVWFLPGSTHGPAASGNFQQPYFPLEKKAEPGITYGVGLKHYINSVYGVRFDVGGRLNPAVHFGLPQGSTGPNSIYIPVNGNNSSLFVSVGVILREGYVAPPPPPNPLVTEAMRVDLPAVPTAAPTISGAHDVCAGDDIRLTVNSNGFPNPTYAWRVGGTAAAGANTTSYSVPTAGASGARNVTVAVTPGPSEATSAPYTTSPGHTYHLTAEAPALNGRQATYQWIVNGQPVSGATSSSYDLPDSGTATVSVRIAAANPPVTSSAANFNINALTPPGLNFAVNPGTVPYSSGPIALNASTTPGPCSGNVTVRYSGEGVTGNSFNPGSVSGFDMGNRLRPQTKTVTLTATATDAKGQSATRTAPVTVTLDPEARRLDDVVFPSLSSRVNNCGKRLLLEELTPMLRNDPGAKVVLIGHRDEKEKGSKANLALDTTRVVNAAAILSAGKGICPSLDLSRIMMKTAGTDQSATPRPALCGSSTNVKEKSGQAIKDSDKNAEYRRVEVWIIPSGAQTPAALSDATPVPAAAVSKVGCPK
jgi:outer membrane protein OmpA-like peptidoglycan-associated protein